MERLYTKRKALECACTVDAHEYRKTRKKNVSTNRVLTDDMIWTVMRDSDKSLSMTGRGRADRKNILHFMLVANNNHSEYIFQWCADNDVNHFPLNQTSFKEKSMYLS